MRTSLARQAAYRLRYHQGKLKPGLENMTHPLQPPAWAKNFPDSTARPSSLFNFTGTTASSTAAVRKVLTENDHGYDIFENPPRRCEWSPAPSLSVPVRLPSSSTDWDGFS